MNNVLKGVLDEELERNLQRQSVFKNELLKYSKGSLQIQRLHDDEYVYRKYRKGNKIISEYIGPYGSEKAKQAILDREQYLKIKKSIKELRIEENKLRRIIKAYD